MTITSLSWEDGIEISTKEEALRFIDESSVTPKEDHGFFEANWDKIMKGDFGTIVNHGDMELDLECDFGDGDDDSQEMPWDFGRHFG